MMKHVLSWQRFRWAVLFLGLTAFIVGCPTLSYRNVQDEFENAVREDYARQVVDAERVFTDATRSEVGPVADGYLEVADTLSDAYIQNLDPKLRANAYLLRSFALLRSGQLTEALQSAAAGLRQSPTDGSRDAVLLRLMSSLAPFAEVNQAWAPPMLISVAEHDKLFQSFKTAMREWQKAMDEIGPVTPPSVEHYLQFQKWRMISTWDTLITYIDANNDGDTDDVEDEEGREMAREKAEASDLLDMQLGQAADAARDAIPEGTSLRRLITTLGGG